MRILHCRRLGQIRALALGAGLALAGRAGAQTFNWNNAAGGVYGTSTNWSPAGPPSTTAHTAVFGINNGFYTVTLGANHTVGTLITTQSQALTTFSAAGRQLTVGTLARLGGLSGVAWNGGTLSVGIFSNTEVNTAFNVGTGSFFRTGGFLLGTAAGSGAATFNAASFVALGSTIGTDGGTGSALTMTNASVGTIAAVNVGQPGTSATGAMSVLTNSQLTVGTMQIGVQGGTVTNSSALVSGGARITMSPDTPLTIGGGSVEIVFGFPSFTLRRGGTLTITANSSTFSAGTPGTFSTSNAPTQVNYGGAILVNNGTFNANSDLQCDGFVSVSSSGNYLGGPTQTTRVDGTQPGAISVGTAIIVGTSPSFVGSGVVTGGTFIVGSGPTSNGWAVFNAPTTGTFTVAAVVGAGGIGRLDAVGLNTPSLILGQSAGGQGTFNAGVYASGTTSTSIAGVPVAGSAIVGNLGSGVVNVRMGSIMTVNGSTDVGLGSGSNGTVSLAGDGTTAIATYAAVGRRMTVGSAGNGTLLVGPFSALNVGTLIVGPTSGTGAGTVIQSGGTVDPTADLLVNPRGSYTLSDGTIAAAVANFGTFTYAGGTVGGVISNSNMLHLNAPLPAGAVVQNAAGARIFAAGGLFSGNGTINNAGTLGGTGTLAAGMTVLNTATFTSAGGDFVIEDGTTFSNGTAALLRNAPASTLRVRTLNFTNTGNVEVNAGGAMEFAKSLNIAPNARLTMKGGLLAVGDGDKVTIAPSGTMLGFGQLDGTLLNNGSVQFNGPSQLVGSLENAAGINVRNATTIVYGTTLNNGSITVQNGTLIFEEAFARGGPEAGPLGGLDGTGSMILQPAGGMVTNYVRQGALNLAGSQSAIARVNIRPAEFGGDSSVVGQLSVAGSPGNYFGVIDLADNGLIINYTTASPLAATRSLIATGYNGGNWLGNGVSSSTAESAPGTGIGYAEATSLGSPATFLGQPVDSTALLIRYTLYGDADLTGAVDLDDFTCLAASFGLNSTWSSGDFNYDNVTNLDDFTALAANFGMTLPVDPPRSTVPEPATAVIFHLMAMITTGRRRTIRALQNADIAIPRVRPGIGACARACA